MARRTHRAINTLLAICAVAVLLSACRAHDQPQPNKVVVYVSADEHVARQVISAFEEQTGIEVDFVGDTEAKKTTGLVQKLRSEKDNPQADVFWSSEIFLTISLANERILEPYESQATAGWPAAWRDDANRWFGFAARARVIAYRPDRIAEQDIPRTWQDLARPDFKGKVVMADPRFGTTGGHLAAMKVYWDEMLFPGYYQRMFLTALAQNDVRLLPGGNAAVVRAVAGGEALIGATDTDDVWAAQAQGQNVAFICPRHHPEDDVPGGGTLLIPNTVGRVAGCRHPDAAGAFIDFLLSEKAERMLAESDSHNIPLNPALAGEYRQYTTPDPLTVEYAAAAAARQRAVHLAMEHLAGGLPGEAAEAAPDRSAEDDAAPDGGAPAGETTNDAA